MVKSTDLIEEGATGAEEASGMYELSYLLSPFLSEEGVAGAVQKIKEMIASMGGVVSSEEAPAIRTLAYTVEYTYEGKKEKIDTAHFGFLRFTAAPEQLPQFQASLRLFPRLARFLLVELPAAALATPKRYGVDGSGQPKGEKGPETKEASPTALSSEELDKTIDELVV